MHEVGNDTFYKRKLWVLVNSDWKNLLSFTKPVISNDQVLSKSVFFILFL